MSSLDDLIQKAQHLRSEGHSQGQIADELSLSMETITWLLTRKPGSIIPKDVCIDWTPVSSNAVLLNYSAHMLQTLYASFCRTSQEAESGIDTVIGIAISGVPLATMIAVREEIRLAIYHPAKHSMSDNPLGSMSGNFSMVAGGNRCLVIDDVITSGNTLREVVAYIKRHGATPVACCVLFDKQSIHEIDGVPVYSLYTISRID
ncbi:MAG: orotate phosphoribosyltransferase-like protein [Methanospirillaceae archaeon]|nr:orotate phosphoribosyltransferase-like protein [Methanospirillaceae archaeon]